MTRRRVWFHRARAALWVLIGVVSFPLGWANQVMVVWLASVYANVVSDLGAGEAADDSDVITILNRIERRVAESRCCCVHCPASAGDSGPPSSP